MKFFILDTLVILVIFFTWIFHPEKSGFVITGLLALIAVNISYIASTIEDKFDNKNEDNK